MCSALTCRKTCCVRPGGVASACSGWTLKRLAFDGRFDGVFSNAVLHWTENPEGVVSGVYRALRPGGRFVGEFGGYGNVAAIVTALVAAREMTCPELERIRNPWFYPTAEQFGALLTANGFELRSCTLVPRPTPLRTGIEGWLRHFRGTVSGRGRSRRRGRDSGNCGALAGTIAARSSGRMVSRLRAPEISCSPALKRPDTAMQARLGALRGRLTRNAELQDGLSAAFFEPVAGWQQNRLERALMAASSMDRSASARNRAARS